MSIEPSRDLVVVVPGKDEREVIKTLLDRRRESLRIRSLTYDVLVHPQRDPGCFQRSEVLLSGYLSLAERALVIFDLEGSGQEGRSRLEVADAVRHRVEHSGWRDRVEVIVIDPELEAWIRAPTPRVGQVLGWAETGGASLGEWMVSEGLLASGQSKPARPKEAMQRVLRKTGMQRSSALYAELARSVGLQSCEDPCFRQLRDVLVRWFGPSPVGGEDPVTAR